MGRKVQVSVCIDLEDLEKLEGLSRESGESLSSLGRQAIKEFLERKIKPIKEASK